MVQQFAHGYALLIGVGRTQYKPYSLPVTIKDVEAVQRALTDAALCAYPEDHIRLLINEQATRPGILAGLQWLQEQCGADAEATAVVYYSGHGDLDKQTGAYTLVTHDVVKGMIPQTGLSGQEFTDALRNLPAKRLLVFIDSCHAEGMASSKDADSDAVAPGLTKSPPPKTLLEALKEGEGRAVFTSSRGSQKSWILKDKTLSIYTHHLLEALDGAGSQSADKVVRVSHVMKHLAETVPATTAKEWNQAQTPFFDMAAEDFPMALLRGGKGLPTGGWQVGEAVQQLQRGTYQATLQGDGVIVQGDHNRLASGGSAIIEGSVSGDVVLGSKGNADEQ